MTSEPAGELPWGEEQWERFMRESDVRSARYGELMETLIDHPDRDEIIAREMGWDRDDDDDEDGEWAWDADDELIEALNEPPTEEEMDSARSRRDALDDIPAYARSYAWSMRIFHALKDDAETLDGDLAELVVEAIGDSQVVAAKIAGGHGMGYDDDSICGNIVNCKRSREAAANSLRALQELGDLRPDLRGRISPLIEEGRGVQRLVEERIAELRSRVWWE